MLAVTHRSGVVAISRTAVSISRTLVFRAAVRANGRQLKKRADGTLTL